MPTRFIPYLVENLIIIKNVTLLSFVLAIPGIIFAEASDWIILNQTYVKVVLIAVSADWFFGSIVHSLYKKDFSLLKNITGIGLKILVMIVMGSLFEALSHLTREDDLIYTYLKMVTRILVFMYPARSAAINCSIITGGRFPPSVLISSFTKFNESLDIGELTNKKNHKKEE